MKDSKRMRQEIIMQTVLLDRLRPGSQAHTDTQTLIDTLTKGLPVALHKEALRAQVRRKALTGLSVLILVVSTVVTGFWLTLNVNSDTWGWGALGVVLIGGGTAALITGVRGARKEQDDGTTAG